MQPVKSICSNSEDRSAIMPGWNLHIKVKFCAATHTGLCVSPKRVHSENKWSGAATNYITEPIGLQPVYVVEAYSEWRRREEVITTTKKVKNGMNAQLRWKKPTERETHTQTHTHRCRSTKPCLRCKGWTQRPSPPLSNPGPAFLFAAIHGSSGHTRTKPLTWLMCWRTAFYLRTTSGLQASLCLLIRHRTCCIGETISGALIDKRTCSITVFIRQSQALWDNICLPHAHTLSLFRTHTQIDDRALIDGSLQNQTDMLLGTKTPLRPFQRIFLEEIFLIIYFYRAAPHAHNLTLSKTRSTSMLLLPSNKQQREKESRVAHEYFATKMSQRAPQKSASCNFNYTRAWPHI